MNEDKEFIPFDLTIPNAIEEGRKEIKKELIDFIQKQLSRINGKLTDAREPLVINQFDAPGRIELACLIGQKESYLNILSHLENKDLFDKELYGLEEFRLDEVKALKEALSKEH